MKLPPWVFVMFRSGKGAVIVVASFAANPKNPDWYQNLVADPDVAVQIGFRRHRTRAEVASEEARREIWPWIVARAPMYADYQRITERTIPLAACTGYDIADHDIGKYVSRLAALAD